METIGLTGLGLVAGLGALLLIPSVREEIAEGARGIWEEARQHAGLIAGVGTLAAMGAAATATAAAAPEAPAAAAATAGAGGAAGAALAIPAAIEAVEAAGKVRDWVDDLVGSDGQASESTDGGRRGE